MLVPNKPVFRIPVNCVMVWNGISPVLAKATVLHLFTKKGWEPKREQHLSSWQIITHDCCYNPPTKYKVLADGSTHWPTDWGSWPTGRPVGQPVNFHDPFPDPSRQERFTSAGTETSSTFSKHYFFCNS